MTRNIFSTCRRAAQGRPHANTLATPAASRACSPTTCVPGRYLVSLKRTAALLLLLPLQPTVARERYTRSRDGAQGRLRLRTGDNAGGRQT